MLVFGNSQLNTSLPEDDKSMCGRYVWCGSYV